MAILNHINFMGTLSSMRTLNDFEFWCFYYLAFLNQLCSRSTLFYLCETHLATLKNLYEMNNFKSRLFLLKNKVLTCVEITKTGC